MENLDQIVDDIIDDACDADVEGVPYWPAVEKAALAEAQRRGLKVTEQDVYRAVQRAVADD